MRGVSRADLALAGGTLLYSAGGGSLGDRELVWLTREGTATQVDPSWSKLLYYPRLSPDGQRVAVTAGEGTTTEVWVKQLDKGPALKVSDGGGRGANWFPDGRTVTFSGPDGLRRVPANGSALPALIRERRGRTFPIATAEYSPDGAWLTYVIAGNVHAARVAGDTAQRDVAVTPFTEFAPAISPDGRWIAYTSAESQPPEIFVRPFPETETTRWQVSNGGGAAARWQRDGKALFYVRPNGDLVAVPILPGAVFTAGVPTVLFSTDPYRASDPIFGYDVHPDGKRFLMLRDVGPARPDELILVENLPDVLAAGQRPR